MIAEAGFRAVAIDVRGYGRSSAPLEVEAYGMLQHVSENLGVVEALAGRSSPRTLRSAYADFSGTPRWSLPVAFTGAVTEKNAS